MKLRLLGLAFVIGGRHVSFSFGFTWPLIPLIQIVFEPIMYFWAGWSPFHIASGEMQHTHDEELLRYRIGFIKTTMQVSTKGNKVYEAEGSINLVTTSNSEEDHQAPY